MWTKFTLEKSKRENDVTNWKTFLKAKFPHLVTILTHGAFGQGTGSYPSWPVPPLEVPVSYRQEAQLYLNVIFTHEDDKCQRNIFLWCSLSVSVNETQFVFPAHLIHHTFERFSEKKRTFSKALN